MRRAVLLAVSLLLCFPLFATEYSITPSSGPVTGGTEVTIKGNFGTWPYVVYFGMIPAAATQRVDEHTLVALTPSHLPGPSSVNVFEYDMFIVTDLTFTFTGNASDAFERVLLPIFVPPVQGAFGSEFHTDLRMYLLRPDVTTKVFGLTQPFYEGENPAELPILFSENGRELPDVLRNGAPGRFLYLPKGTARLFAMNLRVYDVSREGENFGTELPIVSESAFRDGAEVITLLDVPAKPGFRDTLRIYSPVAGAMLVQLDAPGIHYEFQVEMQEGATMFDPAYAVVGDLPTNLGSMRVTISRVPMIITPPIPPPAPFWAFISVTNNETQLITTITPQP